MLTAPDPELHTPKQWLAASIMKAATTFGKMVADRSVYAFCLIELKAKS
jgi:hypothetical protein